MKYRSAARRIAAAITLAVTVALGGNAAGQQVNVGTPANTAGHSFYEQVGVRWGLRGNGWFFNFGGPAPAPAFGGFDPNAGANFGFGGPNGFFNITAGQGSDRSLVSSSPSVTVMNGGTGYFSDTVQRPFVTGLVPVVGSPLAVPQVVPPFAPPESILNERIQRLQTEGSANRDQAEGDLSLGSPAKDAAAVAGGDDASTATRGDLSVATIKAQRAAEKLSQDAALQEEIAGLLANADDKLAAGQTSVAKLYLQMAARKAAGEQQKQIQQRIAALELPAR